MKRLLTLAAMFLCCVATTFAQFSGSGSGTENDPYLILNPIQLSQMRNYLKQDGVYFKLMANIDVSEFIEDEWSSQGWMPIGTSSTPFKGVLDGNAKTISGLWIKRSNADYVGFFGYTQNATIKNVTIVAKDIVGKDNVAGLSGYSDNSTFNGVNFSATKIQGGTNVGGLAGKSNYTTISGCSIISTIEITGIGNDVGGIVGCITSGSISECKVSCNAIIGANGVGGVFGTDNSKVAPITNCHVQGNINGGDDVGGICGHSSGNITNAVFCGNVTATNKAGGISGSCGSGTTSGCYAVAHVNASGNLVGGLIGESSVNNLRDSYFSGTISGNEQVGGLVGYQVRGETCRCYANTTISGAKAIGGLVGKIEGNDQSYAYLRANVAICSSIKATVGNVGRIYGEKGSYGWVKIGTMGTTEENKAWNKAIIVSAGVAQDIEDNEQNGTSVSATTLKLKATYVAMGWDFTNTWEIQETECYPYMKSQTAPPVIQSAVVSGATTISGKCVDGGTVTLEIDGVKQQMISKNHEFSFTVSPLQAGHEVRVSAKADGKEQSYFTTAVVSYLGKGTEADPYQVYTASDLTGVYRKGYFKLMNDIDLTDYINQFSPTEGWESIGREGSETIHFDGNGHKITGLWCNSTRNNTGLFSCFANGTIKNLTVVTAEGKQVKGGANTGILIGKMINGTIENCCVSGTVADGTPVGGMVGLFDGGAISLSQASVVINTTKGTSYVGGLVGEITNGTIDQCFTTGTLTATGSESYIGGLIGKNSGTVTNCFSNAKVSSSYNAAGLVAYNYGLVDKCYAMGDLFSNNYAAGVIGYNDGANAVVSNCAAMNNKIDVVYESQQVQQGGGYGQRIIGGIKNNAPAPAMNNYALKTMQVSVNDVPQIVYDDIMNGTGKTEEELTQQSTYASLGWNFSETWAITENSIYPYLQWITDISSNITVTNVSLNPSSLSLAVGESRTVHAVITPQDATNKSLQWTSSNVAVATVENGVVTAITSGFATITATTLDGSNISATCNITVSDAGEEPSVIEVTDISEIDNVIYIEPMEERKGTETVISFKMKNTAEIRGFQFDIVLPEGVTPVVEDDVILCDLNDDRSPKTSKGKLYHTIDANIQDDGSYRILCGAQQEKTFLDTDGEIAVLYVNIADEMEEGDYPIVLKNIKLTETDINNYYETEQVISKLSITSYVMGDISGDGVVDVSDYIGVANHILGKTPSGFISRAADVNNDDAIDVSDYIGIANIILTGSIYGNSNASSMQYAPKKVNTNVSSIDNVIYVSPFTASAGTETVISFKMKNTAEIRGFQFDVVLPEGMTPVVEDNVILCDLNDDRSPKTSKGKLYHTIDANIQDDGSYRILCGAQQEKTFLDTDGEIAVLYVNIANEMEEGDYPIVLKNIKLTETDISKFYATELVESTVTIEEADTRVVLSETSTTAPESSNGVAVDVRVKRTINANEWSTLVLPFNMSAAQVQAVFNNENVQLLGLAEFLGWETTEYDNNDNATAINVSFGDVNAITANTPYIIKVSKKITEFTVDGVVIDPEDDPGVSVGKINKGTFGSFMGSYVPTTIDEECLFLSENKFWYSTGLTNMKGFRAYFYFQDLLADYNNYSSARIMLSFSGEETTGVGAPKSDNGEKKRDNVIYNLNGQRVSKPAKGLYIINGKKRVVK